MVQCLKTSQQANSHCTSTPVQVLRSPDECSPQYIQRHPNEDMILVDMAKFLALRLASLSWALKGKSEGGEHTSQEGSLSNIFAVRQQLWIHGRRCQSTVNENPLAMIIGAEDKHTSSLPLSIFGCRVLVPNPSPFTVYLHCPPKARNGAHGTRTC